MDYFEYIEDYKAGLLKGDLLTQFEKELALNDALRQAVEDHDVAEMALDMLLEEDIRSVMSEVEITSDEGTKVPGYKSYLWVLIGAVVLGAVGYYWNKSKGPKHEVLFAQNFTPYIEQGTRGDKAAHDQLSLCDKGHFYLTQQKYFVAKETLQKSINTNEGCAKAVWYLALEYLREENYDKCRELLEEIIQTEEHPYRGKAVRLKNRL